MGYLLFSILIGLQATAFFLGQKFLGVWVEQVRLVEMSSAYLPFLAALIIAFRASFNEEILFRLFGINLGKRYLRNAVLAVLLVSLIWGFGHSEYAVFPTWFRGIEVTLMGLVLGFVFLKFGLVAVIIAHYIFDVFWGTAPYLLGKTTSFLFGSSLFIILLPLLVALAAYFINGREESVQVPKVKAKQKVFVIPANDIALKHIGRPLGNTALLGAFCSATQELTLDELIAAIKHRFSAKLQEANIKAAQEGFDFVKNKTKR